MIPDEPKNQSEWMTRRLSFYLRMGPAGEDFGYQGFARAHRLSETSVLTDPQTKNLTWEWQSTLPHTSLLAKQHLKLSNGNEHDLKNVQLVSYKRGTWPGMLKNLGLILLLELLSWQSQMEGVAHGLQGFCGLWWGRKSKQLVIRENKKYSTAVWGIVKT